MNIKFNKFKFDVDSLLRNKLKEINNDSLLLNIEFIKSYLSQSGYLETLSVLTGKADERLALFNDIHRRNIKRLESISNPNLAVITPCLKLIHLIETKQKVEKCLAAIQKIPKGRTEFEKQLVKHAVSAIAYKDPLNSPIGFIFRKEYSNEICSYLNEQQAGKSNLDQIVKHGLLCLEELGIPDLMNEFME